MSVRKSIWWRHQMETFSALLARWTVNSPNKGQWRGVLTFSLICTWTNDWTNHRDASDLRRYRADYGVTIMRVVPAGSAEFLSRPWLALNPVIASGDHNRCYFLHNWSEFVFKMLLISLNIMAAYVAKLICQSISYIFQLIFCVNLVTP